MGKMVLAKINKGLHIGKMLASHFWGHRLKSCNVNLFRLRKLHWFVAQ